MTKTMINIFEVFKQILCCSWTHNIVVVKIILKTNYFENQ